MTFTDDEAIEVLREFDKAPDFIKKAREKYVTQKALITGDGFIDELIKRIEKLESANREEARKKFSRSIKDTTERLFRPLDNVYSATGGTKNYELNDNERTKLLSRVSKIRDGISLQKWLQTHWLKELLHVDPAGMIFLEYVENKKVYPTYKSINSIRGYLPRGQKVEFLVFEPEKVKFKGQNGEETVEIWRFVDDKTDRKFRKYNDEFTLLENVSFEHPFGEVPGLINSNKVKIGTNEIISPAAKIDETLKEYARDQSVLTLYKYTNLMPIFWRYGLVCNQCGGTGKINEATCQTCNGTGYLKRKDITDEIVIPLPDEDTPENVSTIAPNIAGFISPDLDTARYYEDQLEKLEIKLYQTLWGSHKSKIEGTQENRTATEVWLDTQPVMVSLNEYSELASGMEEQLTEWVANWEFPYKEKNKKIATVSYGTRFIIDPPDALLERYISNREKGAPTVVLDRQLTEYITSKYKNDLVSLRMELKKKQFEPYVHYTAKEVLDIFGKLEAQKKILFTDWWETIQLKDLDSKTDLILETERDDYIEQRLKREELE